MAKAVCEWFVDWGLLANVVSHIAALMVGVLVVLCIDKFISIVHMFNYFLTGADLGYRVKNVPRADR